MSSFDEDDSHAANVQAFIDQWSLLTEASELLLSLDPAVQLKVMEGFSPRDTSRDANAIFIKFTRGVARLDGDDNDPDNFVQTWALGADAQALLHSLEPAVRQRVMRDFKPRDASTDVNNVFMKFAQGVALGTSRTFFAQPTAPFQGVQAPRPMIQPPMWRPFAQQRPHAANMFLTPGAGPRAVQQPSFSANAHAVQNFILQWSLLGEAQNVLQSLDPPTQQRVMQEFAPKDVSRDVNAIFCKFARGFALRAPQGVRAPGVHSAPARLEVGTEVVEEVHEVLADTEAFADMWKLGPEAYSLLVGLPSLVRTKVMQEFAPRDTGSDVNNVFMKFAQGVERAALRSPGPAPAAYLPRVPFGRGVVHSGTKQDEGMSFADVDTFAEHWRLGPEAHALLIGLPAAVQATVMQEFSPRDTGSDVSNLFMKFAQGVEKRGARVPGPAPNAYLPRALVTHSEGGTDEEQADGSESAETAAFAEKWRLGPEAQTILNGLSAPMQAKVMQEFSPRDAESDVNNVFMKFAQGVARGCGKGKGKGKGYGPISPAIFGRYSPF